MPNNNHIQIQEDLEKKAKEKENRKQKMKISGQSVKELAKIIKEKGKKNPK
ncbi:MAG: hypothetical protein WC663_04090 [Patescibacteria group bacterium]|jgi:hypothetical protein